MNHHCYPDWHLFHFFSTWADPFEGAVEVSSPRTLEAAIKRPPCQAPSDLILSACTLVILKRFSRSARLAERVASLVWSCDSCLCLAPFDGNDEREAIRDWVICDRCTELPCVGSKRWKR